MIIHLKKKGMLILWTKNLFLVKCIEWLFCWSLRQIVAFIVEGRTGRKSSRRPSKGGYRKLKPSADDIMPSLEKSTTSTSYVY